MEVVVPDGTVIDIPDNATPAAIQKAVTSYTTSAQFYKNVDLTSGAPKYVRALVGGAPTAEDRLSTLKKFFPDAEPAPGHPDNFIFTNPDTHKLTLYNPPGLEGGDVASVAKEGAQTAGATVGTIGGAAVGGPLGGVVGAGAGMAAGSQLFDAAARSFGMSDTRTPAQRVGDVATDVALGSGGEALGAGAGALLRAGVKAAVRGGEAGRQTVAGRIVDFAQVGSTPSVAEATDSRALDSVENILAKTPGASGQIAAKAQETIDKVNTFVQKRVENLAPSGAEPEVAGAAVKEGIEGQGGFVERFKTAADNAYSALDKRIPATQGVDASNTVDMLQNLAKPIEGAPALSQTKLFGNATVKDVADAFQADYAKGSIPYGALKELRSRVGAKLANPQAIEGIDRGQLKQLYGAISDDLKKVAEDNGALDQYNQATQLWQQGIKKIDTFLQPLLDKKTPEQVFKSLESSAKEGSTNLREVFSGLNQDQKDSVVGTVLQRLGSAKPGQQNDAGSAFSLETYLTNWNKLNPKAKDVLFNDTSYPGLRDDLDTIARIASTGRQEKRAFANPSGTAGQLLGMTMLFGTAGFAARQVMEGDIGGAAMTAGSMGAVAGGANLAARLMTNPKFVHWLAESTKIAPNGFSAHLGKLGAIAATSDPDTRQAILTYMQGFTGLGSKRQSQ